MGTIHYKLVNHIRQCRQQLNMTQAELAEATGVSRQTISDIETGAHEPIITAALIIARALELSVDDLFEIIAD